MEAKIIYSDDGRDRAITGSIAEENDLFVVLKTAQGQYRIAKKSIVCMKERKGDDDGREERF